MAELSEEIRQVYRDMYEFVEAAESLLEWCPVCSIGSSGYLRQEKLREIVTKMRAAMA